MRAPLTLPIVIGKTYVRRDGVVVPARPPHPSLSGGAMAYVSSSPEDVQPLEHFHVYIETGRVEVLNVMDDRDLIADWVDVGAAPPPVAAPATNPARYLGEKVFVHRMQRHGLHSFDNTTPFVATVVYAPGAGSVNVAGFDHVGNPFTATVLLYVGKAREEMTALQRGGSWAELAAAAHA